MFSFFRHDNDDGHHETHIAKNGKHSGLTSPRNVHKGRRSKKLKKRQAQQDGATPLETGLEEISHSLRTFTRNLLGDHEIPVPKQRSKSATQASKSKPKFSKRHNRTYDKKLIEARSVDFEMMRSVKESAKESVKESASLTLSNSSMDEGETQAGGVEITLNWEAVESKKMLSNGDNEEEYNVPIKPVFQIEDKLRKCKRVYRSQFSTSYPALKGLAEEVDSSHSPRSRRRHRVPLLEAPPETAKTSYQDMVLLLQNHPTKDEVSAARDELHLLNLELEALGEDRYELDKKYMHLPPSPTSTYSRKNGVYGNSWDANVLLGNSRSKLSPDEKDKLKCMRGVCLSVHIHNPRAREAFLSKCGSKIARSRGFHQSGQRETSFVTLEPSNCRRGGAGENIQHLAIMNGNDAGAAFFFSRDNGKSYTWGHLPPRLFRRMKQEGLDRDGDLVYLSTGPRGSYYAQFRTGHCWWGNAVENDNDFHAIMRDWDVYRVVFGPIITHEHDGDKYTTSSWIILGRDGRAAWKNVPSRLHNLLSSRLADWAAPAEVALGCGDSYFIRFLDGTIDYCLPAAIADECSRIELRGGSITGVILHADVSNDFIIRHTEVNES